MSAFRDLHFVWWNLKAELAAALSPTDFEAVMDRLAGPVNTVFHDITEQHFGLGRAPATMAFDAKPKPALQQIHAVLGRLLGEGKLTKEQQRRIHKQEQEMIDEVSRAWRKHSKTGRRHGPRPGLIQQYAAPAQRELFPRFEEYYERIGRNKTRAINAFAKVYNLPGEGDPDWRKRSFLDLWTKERERDWLREHGFHIDC